MRPAHGTDFILGGTLATQLLQQDLPITLSRVCKQEGNYTMAWTPTLQRFYLSFCGSSVTCPSHAVKSGDSREQHCCIRGNWSCCVLALGLSLQLSRGHYKVKYRIPLLDSAMQHQTYTHQELDDEVVGWILCSLMALHMTRSIYNVFCIIRLLHVYVELSRGYSCKTKCTASRLIHLLPLRCFIAQHICGEFCIFLHSESFYPILEGVASFVSLNHEKQSNL